MNGHNFPLFTTTANFIELLILNHHGDPLIWRKETGLQLTVTVKQYPNSVVNILMET